LTRRIALRRLLAMSRDLGEGNPYLRTIAISGLLIAVAIAVFIAIAYYTHPAGGFMKIVSSKINASVREIKSNVSVVMHLLEKAKHDFPMLMNLVFVLITLVVLAIGIDLLTALRRR